MTWTDDTAAAYIAGMIDGEGSVSKPGTQNRQVRIYNTERELLDAVAEACDQLGIAWRIYDYENYKTEVLTIMGKENLERVLACVPIQSTRKLERLRALVGEYSSRSRRRYQTRVSA